MVGPKRSLCGPTFWQGLECESTEASALANFGHIFQLRLRLKFAEVSAEVYVSFIKIKFFNLLVLKICGVLLSLCIAYPLS